MRLSPNSYSTIRQAHHLLAELDYGRPMIFASGQVIGLPGHVSVGPSEELTHGSGLNGGHILEHRVDHGQRSSSLSKFSGGRVRRGKLL